MMARQEKPPRRLPNTYTADALPTPEPARLMLWRFTANARDASLLCRALRTCEGVCIKRCTPVVEHRENRIRVDILLPENCVDRALHNVIQQVNSAEIGRIQPLQDS